MSIFEMYVRLGVMHITDLAGYDHILFLLALCAVYTPTQWKRIAILVTAFTLGHATTLVLASLDIIPVNRPLVELLIAVTIAVTAIYNIVWQIMHRDLSSMRTPSGRWQYALAIVFGCIHGMGFSGDFRSLVGGGSELIVPLFSFNLGIEIGQCLIVLTILAAQWIVLRLPRIRPPYWTYAMSIIALLLAIKMIMERA